MTSKPLRWASGTWDELRETATLVRRRVFVEEMGIAEGVDFDGTDADCLHLVAFDESQPVGTGRLRPCETRIGRMAVLREARNRGIGSAILRRLMREAVRMGLTEVALHAQTQVVGLYRAHGFDSVGPEFEEAGIPHQLMRRKLEWRQAVAGLLLREGRVLLGLRAPKLSMGNHWDLFGGKVESGESDRTALSRELEEELSIRAEPDAHIGTILYDDDRGSWVWRCPVYRVLSWEGEPAINKEHIDFKWFSRSELHDLTLAHQQIARLLDVAVGAIQPGVDVRLTPADGSRRGGGC